MQNSTLSSGVLVLTVSVGLISCLRHNGDGDLADQAADSMDVAQREAALLYAATAPITTETTAEAVATASAAAASSYFEPTGCATAVAHGAQVTYTLDDCTGPYGLLHVRGTIEATYTMASDGVHTQLDATSLSVNGTNMDVDAQGIYTSNGVDHQLVVSTSGAGTGPRGNQFTRSGSYTVRWDAGDCIAVDGRWSTQIGGAIWSTEVSEFQRCASSCPAVGGEIRYTGGITGVTIAVSFDGTDIASFTTSRGRNGAVSLFCTP